jgi:hypothetical protein
VDETVAALAGAASVATEATGQVARSLFNFAAKSLQTVVHGVSSVTGHQQVGHHRVAIVKELAQGGFGIVFLVRDTQHPDRLYAMKQMFCQSREQVGCAAFLEWRVNRLFMIGYAWSLLMSLLHLIMLDGRSSPRAENTAAVRVTNHMYLGLVALMLSCYINNDA